MLYLRVIASLLIFDSVTAWTQNDFEIFDVVEDVNENFYTFLGLPEDVDSAEIRKTYRKLSLQYHPDKNKQPGAEEKFRKLVAVVEILKDEEKRKKYDLVLKNGLPDWRQPVFYYRRVRKLGGKETALLLVALFTFGQYIISWAAYWERKYEVEETVFARFKHKDRKSKKSCAVNEEELRAAYIGALKKPHWQDLLIVKLLIFSSLSLKALPSRLLAYVRTLQEQKPVALEPESSDEESAPEDTQARERKPRRRVRLIPDASELVSCDAAVLSYNSVENHSSAAAVTGEKRPWSEEDTIGLIRAMKKYPTGTVNRWLKIADLLNHSQDEVIAVVKQLRKAPSARNIVPHAQGVSGEDYEDRASDDEMTRADHIVKVSKKASLEEKPRPIDSVQKKEEWNLVQQKWLEAALQQYPKGMAERWDKIAAAVPGKTKEECMLRYKHLVEVLRKKKAELKENAM